MARWKKQTKGQRKRSQRRDVLRAINSSESLAQAIEGGYLDLEKWQHDHGGGTEPHLVQCSACERVMLGSVKSEGHPERYIEPCHPEALLTYAS